MDFTNYTGNEEFNKNGFIVVRNLVDKEAFKEDVPSKGHYNWDIHTSTQTDIEEEGFVNRLNQSKYSGLVLATKDIIEKALERKVKSTYWLDRWYESGENLERHKDWACCEISVTLHLDSNISGHWPIGMRSLSGEEFLVNLDPGDAIIYNGTYREHWRPYLPYEYNNDGTQKEVFYHQIFMHYVLRDGRFSELGYEDLPPIGIYHNDGMSAEEADPNIYEEEAMLLRRHLDEINYTGRRAEGYPLNPL